MTSPARSISAVALASVALGGVVAACNGGAAPASAVPSSPSPVVVFGCPTTLVHYTPRPGTEPSLRALPWIATTPNSTQIVGHLFYYGVHGVIWRGHHARGLRIYPGGTVPASGGAQTKILWIDYSRRSRGPMTIDGQRLDAPGEFHQTFAVLGASVIDVPSKGCWRVTVHTRTTRGQITMLATGANQSRDSGT
jgi:hypothetical protein